MNASPVVSFLVYLLSGEWRRFVTRSAARSWVESNAQDAELFDSAGAFHGLFRAHQGWVL